MKYARSFALAFLATGAMVQAAKPVQPVRYADKAGWDCKTRGNGKCGSLIVPGKLSAKGVKPIQSITVRVMPEEVFWGQDGAVYISHKSETSCVAWVDQAAVAGKKKATGGQDVLKAAFDECGKTFE